MPPPNRPREPTGHANWEWIVTDDGSRTLFDSGLAESFHSGCGAVSETLVVYILHSGLLGRLRGRDASVVMEYGLGTATGFLLTAALAEFYQTPLTYYALEWSLLPADIFRQLELHAAVKDCLCRSLAKPARGVDPEYREDEFQHLPRLLDAWCEWVTHSTSTKAQLSVHCRLSEFVQLELVLGDAREVHTPRVRNIPRAGCDAVYFDPFSPESNPELWSPEIFRQAFEFLKPGGQLSSYCVKSSVRRDLADCGFQIQKVPGPVGGKREVLLASRLPFM